ncbi:hypothetical protein BYT27DRAFT_6897286 [Phlegmacium glaucopus]|nr:hypothetical protein BYT27DRAFT_6897286 [Phlegmacium glaucopus]
MQLKSIFFTIAQVLVVLALVPRDEPVLTAERIYHTIIDQSPFLVERTTQVVWTQSPSITQTLPTDTPVPVVE